MLGGVRSKNSSGVIFDGRSGRYLTPAKVFIPCVALVRLRTLQVLQRRPSNEKAEVFQQVGHFVSFSGSFV